MRSTGGSLETGHALLTPVLIAPINADLSLRNYSNQTALSVSNLRLTMGGGGMAEVNAGGVRALTLTHDSGTNLVCGQTTVLSLSASTGACVQGALGVL